VSFFLRAKHWQIFLLLVGVGCIGDVAGIAFTLATPRPPEEISKAALAFMVLWVFLMGILLAWFWSMGSFLNSIVSPALKRKMGFFRFAVLYPALYTIVFTAVFQSSNAALLMLILPLHFFAMFCMFYDIYFVSKGLMQAERGARVSFYDYAGPFFLLWFFPIGIWFIQPKINRLYTKQKNTQQIPESPRLVSD
jgi:hypothetical protein